MLGGEGQNFPGTLGGLQPEPLPPGPQLGSDAISPSKAPFGFPSSQCPFPEAPSIAEIIVANVCLYGAYPRSVSILSAFPGIDSQHKYYWYSCCLHFTRKLKQRN